MAEEQAVIIRFSVEPDGGLNWDELYDLEDDLESTVSSQQCGEFDGNEIGVDGSITLLLYGADARNLFSYIEPVLKKHPMTKDGTVILRFGPPDDSTPQELRMLN